mmetsp:Transcript_151141/g.485547  ORF Transcript_151141/g.485547 Transcript_151141/m.485547 type:complete len:243 (-) Transcript_151141:136-864(-)
MDTLSPTVGFLDETGTGEDEADFVNPDLPQLHRMWRNEKYAPELLPFNVRVVQNISEVVEYVGEDLDQDRQDEDQDPNDPSYVLRCKDLERVKYALRDYLRIRLWKLQKYPQHYLESKNLKLLSDAERTFLREHWHHKKQFFESRMLSALPPSKQSLDDKIDLLDMVRRPCLDKYTYARILEDVGDLEVPSASLTQESSQGSRRDSFQKGRTYLVHYGVIRPFLIEPEHAGENQTYPKVDLV